MIKTFELLEKRASWLRKETLKIHKIAPEIRVASCLSAIEILTVLYYGKVLRSAASCSSKKRDRLIVSKGHGAVGLYPILADLGLIEKKELEQVCSKGGILGSIPDCLIPGIETINGSLGHGLGVGAGLSIALKNKNIRSKVFVLVGDGELYEGSNWEAIMFAAQNKLGNLILIIDNNKISMLDYCRNIIDLEPLENKFEDFGWKAKRVNGHSVKDLYRALNNFKNDGTSTPKVIIADTIKGKGAPVLEKDPLCHVRSLSSGQIDSLIEKMK